MWLHHYLNIYLLETKNQQSRRFLSTHSSLHFAVLLPLSSRYDIRSIARRTDSLGLVGLLLSIFPLCSFEKEKVELIGTYKRKGSKRGTIQ